MIWYLLLYILFGPVKLSATNISTAILDKNAFEDAVWKLTHEIVEKYYKEYLCLTYITSDLDTSWPLNTDLPVLSIDLTDDYSQDDIILQSYNDGCGGYVIRSKPERKEEIMKNLHLAFTNATNFRYNTQKYLYLPYDEKDQEISVLNIKEMFWFPEIIMVTLSSKNPYNFSLISHTYFHGYKYDVLGIKYETLEYWTPKKGFENGLDIYYDKTLNVYGKKFWFGLIEYPPYAIIIPEGDNKFRYDGLETRIAAMYVDIHNGTWDAFDHPNLFWGDVHEDGHADGILGSVMYHRADFGFAAVYQWHCDAVACSYPYVYAAITCMVPRPHRKSGWLTVILPFTPRTWIGFTCVYLISSLFVFGMMTFKARVLEEAQYRKTMPGMVLFEAFYNTFRLQLEQVPKIAARKDSVGFYYRFCDWYYFFVACCWIGGISSILTVPRFEEPINTTWDLIVRYPKLEWGANAVAWIESIRQSSDPLLKIIVEKYVVLDDETLNKRTKTEDFAFFIERLPNGHYGMNDYIDEESLKYLKIMGEDIYTSNTVIVQPRGCPWQKSLDELIFRLFDAGIIQKLEIQVSLDAVNNRLQNMVRTSNDKPKDELSPLQIRHLEGPIFIYLGGTVISTATFFLELSYERLKKIISKARVKKLT